MNDHERDDTERDVARLLEVAGPREALPEELRARWEAHFRAELAAARPGRRRRLLLTVSALGVCIAVLLLSLNRFAIDPSSTLR